MLLPAQLARRFMAVWVLTTAIGQPPPLLAQRSGGGLRLGELYRELFAQNPRINAARSLADASVARVPSARRPPDPEVQIALMNRQLPGFGLQEPLGMNQIQLMQMVPIPGKLRLAGQAADSRALGARVRVEEVTWEVRSRVAMAFYDLHQIDRSLEVAAATQDLLRDIAKTAEVMYAVGQGRQADVLRAQVEIARMTEEITRMGAMREAMAARLNALLARPQSTLVASPILPVFPDTALNRDSLEAEAAAARPMVRAGRHDLAAAEASSRLARRELWPDPQLGVIYGQRPMEAGTDRMISIMVGFSVPLFAGSRQLKMREETRAMEAMARSDLETMLADTRGRVGELYAEIGRAQRLRQLYRGTILPQAETTVASSIAAYRVGEVNLMTLLDNQMTVNQYRQELYRLEADEGKAWAELEMLLGRSLFDPDRVSGTGGGE